MTISSSPAPTRRPTLLVAIDGAQSHAISRNAGDAALLELLLWCALHEQTSIVMLRDGRVRRLPLDRPGRFALG